MTSPVPVTSIQVDNGPAEPKSDKPFWYFAIGSMMNPISLANRNIVPLESKPAELLDHRLYFFGTLGMAEAIADEGYSFHGVLHKVDPKTMAELDKIEMGYTRKDAIAKFYDGRCVTCTVYAREGKERGPHIDKPPTERYLEIMRMGAEHFGVAESHLTYLKYHEMQKRHLPHEFEGFPVPYGVPQMTMAEVEKMDGQDGRRLAAVINGKVRECILPRDTQGFKDAVNFRKVLGANMMTGMAKNLYDPKYGTPSGPDQFTKEHAHYLEDLIYSMAKKRGTLHEYKIIGTVPVNYKKEVKLYWALGSQPSRALKAFFCDSGIEFKSVSLNISKGEHKSPEVLALNPAGTIPFITIDGTLFTETVAIMRFLARKCPEKADKFYPCGDAMKKYQIDRWCDFYTDGFRPAFTKHFSLCFRAKSTEKRDFMPAELEMAQDA